MQKLSSSQTFNDNTLPIQSNIRVSRVVPVPNEIFIQKEIPPSNFVVGVQQIQ